MTYEKALISQAELRIVRGSTNERKQMSTKTLRKRIALVAVSALGFGLISVAPSNAAATAASISLNKGTITAGAESISATITGAATTASIGIRVTTPTGSLLYGSDDTTPGTGFSSNITCTALASLATTCTIAAAALLEPGTYTITGITDDTASGAATDSASEILALVNTGGAAVASTTLTVVSPATSTGVGISVSSSIIATGGAPVVRAWRPTNGVSGEIKFITDRSADLDIAAGTVEQGADTTSTTGSFDTYTLSEDDVAGTYVVSAWVDTNDNNIVDGSEPTASVSFTISSATSATDVITVTTSASVVDDEQALTICATITDASGRPLVNALTVKSDSAAAFDAGSISALDVSASAQAMTRDGSTNRYCATTVAESGTLVHTASVDYLDVTFTVENAADTAEATAIVRLVETAQATIPTTSGATIFSLVGGDGIGSVTSGVRQTLKSTGGANIGTSTATTGMIQIDKSLTTQTFNLALASSQAGEYVKVVVAPKAAQSAAIIAGSTSYKQVTADGTVVFTVTTTAPTAGTGYTVTVSGDQTSVAYIQYATATPTVTVSPTATIKAIYGASTPLTASLADQFGRPMAAKTLVYNTSGGRNATLTGTLTTGTDGSAAYTLKDAVTDTVNLTDTVTFTYNYVDADGAATTASASRSVTYSATGVVVGSVTITPASTSDVTISQSSSSGSSTYVVHTVQVYLSTGLPAGSGVLVTCAAGADDKFYLGVTTAVTGAAGTAACNVFRTKTGSTAVTATAGGITSPAAASVTFVNDPGDTLADGTTATGASSARNVSVTAAQSSVGGSAATVVAKVTDRYGNPVAGVLVTWSHAGVGRPVTGADLTVGTDTNGQAQVQVTSLANEAGVATVTATIGTASNQTLDAAGFVGAVAVSGVTAGNYSASGTVTFTKDTSTSTADALLALAQALGTRDQASATVDAAAEATDAANAATDAANAAAEAADAATAAAQDASDAVAALSAQVSEAIAGLKKQLVSLTNLVIKIQKKVNA